MRMPRMPAIMRMSVRVSMRMIVPVRMTTLVRMAVRFLVHRFHYTPLRASGFCGLYLQVLR